LHSVTSHKDVGKRYCEKNKISVTCKT